MALMDFFGPYDQTNSLSTHLKGLRDLDFWPVIQKWSKFLKNFRKKCNFRTVCRKFLKVSDLYSIELLMFFLLSIVATLAQAWFWSYHDFSWFNHHDFQFFWFFWPNDSFFDMALMEFFVAYEPINDIGALLKRFWYLDFWLESP